MIKREVDVVKRIAYLMSNRRGKSSYDGTFLRLVKLGLKLASTSKFGSHLIKGGGQRTHLVLALCRYAKIEIASCHLSSSNRELFYRPGESPHQETCNQRCYEQ